MFDVKTVLTGKGVLIHALFGKHSLGPPLTGSYTAKPEKQSLEGCFPKKGTCDVSPDPRPKQKSSGFQKKSQDSRGERSCT